MTAREIDIQTSPIMLTALPLRDPFLPQHHLHVYPLDRSSGTRSSNAIS
ncbi:hypothetical protein P775_17845 [Puniceibacterium antarcticum]|uniref:Uncharacterized protein n=1 Tax=Puniceibacterium antarcticum TaxID=1206336 RepID=A0A2G8RBG3_9RHOB|nr:hypothetical protein [Puniceibacterium antarcticum]PIL18905.1 hypothetical protein P775_17845 [Puniceibacterium antarcticum]